MINTPPALYFHNHVRSTQDTVSDLLHIKECASGDPPLGSRGMPERLKCSSWSSCSVQWTLVEAAYYRRSLPFLVIRLFATLLAGELFAAARGPCTCLPTDLIVVAGLPDLRARTATLAVPSTCPTRSITPPFHDHAGYLVKELKHKNSDFLQDHATPFHFLPLRWVVCHSHCIVPFTFLPFHPSVYPRLRLR